MKAMILAAGLGERMRPLTNDCPKPLIQVHGQALIEHHLRRLAAAKVDEVIINTYYLADQITNKLGDGSQYGVRIHYSNEDELLNTGGGITKALPLLGDEPFIVIASDIYSEFDFASLPKQLDGLAHLVLVDNPDYHQKGDYALQDNIVRLQGDKLNYAGIAVVSPKLFAGCDVKPFAIAPLFQQAIEAGQCHGQHYRGVWFNIGTPQELEKCQNI